MIPRGSVRTWMSLVPPPDGWDFFPSSIPYHVNIPMPIFATTDHDNEPRLFEEDFETATGFIKNDLNGISRQGRIAGKTQP